MGGVALAQSADASTPLPARSAEQLLVDLQTAPSTPISGTITDSVDLGLPELPSSMTSGSQEGSPATLLSGDHTWRVWSDGKTKSRLSLLADQSETNIVRNGDQVWQWSSASQTATHFTIDPEAKKAHPQSPDEVVPRTPSEAAQWALQKIDPTTEVSTAGTATVAGRPAYELVLTPRDTASRVASVRLAVDSEKKVPLRVQVFSTKTTASAIDIGFSSVSFQQPAASVFDFTPPPGAKVLEPDKSDKPESGHGDATTPDEQAEPTVTGTGWTSVVSGRVPDEPGQKAEHGKQDAAHQGESGEAQQFAELFPQVSGSWGTGRVLDGTLISIVITDDGRYAAGAVAPSALYAALPPA